MSNIDAVKFMRDIRDRQFKETRNKSPEEIRNYFKEKARWIYTPSEKNNFKTRKARSRS